jgi:hypothetical protein
MEAEYDSLTAEVVGLAVSESASVFAAVVSVAVVSVGVADEPGVDPDPELPVHPASNPPPMTVPPYFR